MCTICILVINICMSFRIFANSQTSLVFPGDNDSSQANAGQLNAGFNVIVPPQNALDAVQLPLAISGTVVWGMVIGGPGEFLGIYAKNGTTDTINGYDNDVIFSFPNFPVSTSQNLICVCGEDGSWFCNIGVPPG